MYLFTPTPNTAGAATRFEQICYDGGRMVQVRGRRRRSLVCAVRFGDKPIANGPDGELPVPLMQQRQGFPRTYLQNRKTQRPGIMVPDDRGGFTQTVQASSEPLVFGNNVADGTPLSVAVLEYLEHDELETGPVDLRPRVISLVGAAAGLKAEEPIRPADIGVLQAPQKRLVTGMRVMLRKTPAAVTE
jgi:hypothetical protein